MAYKQLIERAGLEADIAFERFVGAPEAGGHPELLDELNTEATLNLSERSWGPSLSAGHSGFEFDQLFVV